MQAAGLWQGDVHLQGGGERQAFWVEEVGWARHGDVGSLGTGAAAGGAHKRGQAGKGVGGLQDKPCSQVAEFAL